MHVNRQSLSPILVADQFIDDWNLPASSFIELDRTAIEPDQLPLATLGDFMKQVIGISLGSSREDFSFTARFLGKDMSVQRIGTNGSVAKALHLLHQSKRNSAAIGLGMPTDDLGIQAAIQRSDTGERRRASGRNFASNGRFDAPRRGWVITFNNARVLFFDGVGDAQTRLAVFRNTPRT